LTIVDRIRPHTLRKKGTKWAEKGTKKGTKWYSHLGCTFSKGKLLSILAANTFRCKYVNLGFNMYILGANTFRC